MGALERLGLLGAYGQSQEITDALQRQVSDAFGFKWGLRSSFESETSCKANRTWLIDRYCGGDELLVLSWLTGGRKIIVDAGCGAGFSALNLFGELLREHDYLGLDVSTAVDVAKQRFSDRDVPGEFVQVDFTCSGVPDGTVDIVFAEGVLHHTPSTEQSLMAVVRMLRPGGRILFYVYAKKALIREYCDDIIREKLRPLSNDEAWNKLLPLTKLGAALGKLNVQLEVPEEIELLGLKAGSDSLQRFFYWNICKTFYREDFTLEEMNHLNFDWYRPLYCHRHTESEVREYCQRCGLDIERFVAEPSGFSVVATRST